MMVHRADARVFHRQHRGALTGQGLDDNNRAHNQEKGFEQYLIEAFQGEVVQNGDNFAASKKLSPLARKNLIRLSQI